MVNMGWPALTTSLKSGKPNTASNQNGPSYLGKIHDTNNPCQYSMTNINQYQSQIYGQYGMTRIDRISHSGKTKDFCPRNDFVNMTSLALTIITRISLVNMAQPVLTISLSSGKPNYCIKPKWAIPLRHNPKKEYLFSIWYD